MSPGFSVGDIFAISDLAVKVYTAYKDAPDDYKYIAEEVKSLQIIINKATQHFESTPLSDNDRQEGQEVLRGCQSVLRDLDSLIEECNSLDTANKSQVFKRVQLGTENIATLRAGLTANTTLLSSFIRNCEYLEILARLAGALGQQCTNPSAPIDSSAGSLHRTNSRVSVSSVTGSINTKRSFKAFCKDFYGTGVTAEVISQKNTEILNMLMPQNTAIDDSDIAGDSQLPTLNWKQSWFGWALPMHIFGPLMLAAAEAGNTKHLISTLQYIQNIDFKNNRKETALHKAAEKGHMEIVQLVLGKGASIQAKNKSGDTPLHLATRRGHTRTVELLLEKGASIETKGTFKDTPLHIAVQNGHTSMVGLLLEKGASIEARDKTSYTPLHIAALLGHTSIVGLLLKKGALIEATDSLKHTPLHDAAEYGHTSTAELLLEEGASIGAKNIFKVTPLHLAAQNGRTSTVKLLLGKGAPMETKDILRDTPLDDAIGGGYTDIVELFKNKSC